MEVWTEADRLITISSRRDRRPPSSNALVETDCEASQNGRKRAYGIRYAGRPRGALRGLLRRATLRAVENFPITGIAISGYPQLISALGAIKQAAALALTPADSDVGQDRRTFGRNRRMSVVEATR
jgi:hypothetical protein